MTSPSARTRAATAAVAVAFAASAVLAAPAAPAAAGSEPGPVAEAPILDLDLRVDDLTLATESEDGSLTDATDGRERTVTLAADVLFEFDRASLGGKSKEALAEAAAIIGRDADGATVDIVGYTDAKGAEPYNLRLSKRRADAVEERLASMVEGADVTYATAGRGSADPVAPNEIDGRDNPDGRAKNRRVEIRFPR